MPETALRCPQCGAPIAPSAFARLTTCPHCGSSVELDEGLVDIARFRRALEERNNPFRYGLVGVVVVEGLRWARLRRLGQGDRCEVFGAIRARWPSERVVLKVLGSPRKRRELDREHANLLELQELLGSLLAFRFPSPVVKGVIEGAGMGRKEALVLRCPAGHFASATSLASTYPPGIPPRPAIWLWRRVLESLAVLHRDSWCHGAVVAEHLLVEAGEHGARLIGFEAAGRAEEELPEWAAKARSLSRRSGQPPKHGVGLDIAMSAEVVTVLLGLDRGGSPGVPEALRELLERARCFELGGSKSLAWEVRTRLGEIARETYGAPVFCPLDVAAAPESSNERGVS